MKKKPDTIENIKQKIEQLKGEEVNFHINRGRRKTAKFRARIENVYTSVFTARSDMMGMNGVATYSYNDILCGEVKISKD